MTTITKFSTEWFCALDAFVAERRDMPFKWGANDCFTLAADWLVKVRGEDLMADLRVYSTMLGAYRLLEQNGGVLAAATSRLGDPIQGSFAQVGDVVMARHGDDRLSLGVCVGGHIAVPGDDGLVLVPITAAEAAWRA